VKRLSSRANEKDRQNCVNGHGRNPAAPMTSPAASSLSAARMRKYYRILAGTLERDWANLYRFLIHQSFTLAAQWATIGSC
jgi:hypothetical protein